mmetsp:Transcript_15902/g.25218  ORF Transcript_15902/g.25218 Transcript_15902/m.25218 type:complete len:241 (-) Transcript_15902:214-936(-)|eukprot:CAMPEP_0197048614 /NCGR_PEP_ID=MMETSP1384-20130603/23934_1 /TAXON_ID=29189 /ORGANISM="Ammonia sp." /LENGTH=240 /DNA_ID=CAMNT_0042480773 /DNA_START=20 /DNA_END=742 /DNA_ORIENTATION=-
MSMFELDLGRLGPSADEALLTTISEPPEMPQTKNVVATMHVKCKLDLKEIMTKSRNSEYNPKRFAAVIMRIRQPKSTALIFSSGKIVITGAKTTDDAFISARKYVRILQKLEFPAKFTDYKVVNIVACCSVRFSIRLESLAHFKPQNASYEPELFPGLIYRMSQPKVVILIFVSGKIVLTGAKSKQEIDQSFRRLWPILQKFGKQYHLQSNHNHQEDQHMDLDDLDEEEDDDAFGGHWDA